MTNLDPNYDPDDDGADDDATDDNAKGSQLVRMSRSDIRALEKKAKAGTDAQRLGRENVLLKLGVDTDSVGGKMLLDQENLPWDKPDSILEVAKGINALKPAGEPEATATTAPETTAEAGEAAQTTERATLATGAAPDNPMGEDPYGAAMQNQRAVIAQGGHDIDGLAAAVSSIRQAGAKGDARVMASEVTPNVHYPPTSRT